PLIQLGLVLLHHPLRDFFVLLRLGLVKELLGLNQPVEVDGTPMVALRRVYPVLSVEELDYVAVWVPNGEVVFDLQVLQCVDQPPLHVPALLLPDRSVHQPFSSSHGMEEELSGGKSVPVVAPDETLGLGGGVVPGEVAEGPPLHTMVDSLPSYG